MKVKVNTMVDVDLRKLYDASASVHRKTVADALEVGMRVILKDIDPVAVFELEINTRSAELEEMRRLRAQMRVLEPNQKRIAQFEDRKATIEAARQALWEKRKPLLMKGLRVGDVNWNVVLFDFQFKSKSEALPWFWAQIEKEKEKENTEAKP